MGVLRLHNRMEVSEVNGPGRRSVIWLQGCTLACPGCWNPETHLYKDGVYHGRTELLNWVEEMYDKHRIEGVTYSGGEPCHQLIELGMLAKELRKKMPWLSQGLFTGYTEKELDTGRVKLYNQGLVQPPKQPGAKVAAWCRLKANLDFGVFGRYNQQAPSGAPMLTSTNQALRFFTKRYDQRDFPEQATEVSINPQGIVTITGFPTLGIPA